MSLIERLENRLTQCNRYSYCYDLIKELKEQVVVLPPGTPKEVEAALEKAGVQFRY